MGGICIKNFLAHIAKVFVHFLYFLSKTSAQSGFRPGHSTQDLLLKVIEEGSLDCDDLVGAVFVY